ncbi:MAG: tetratricopeptide repeat protein [Planctomycetota bacterium]|nr:tetratricopeptide repeat protein [Planctomycetota bacterium]
MADEQTVDEILPGARKLLRDGQFPAALAEFERALAVDELEPDVHDGLATAHYLQGNLELAAKHFERVTRLDPRRGSAWINLGAVYNRLLNHTKAVEVLRRAVQVERTSAAAFYNLGSAYRHLKQWALAVPAYREAIRLEPDQPDAYVNLGLVYLEMKNIPQATVQFKKALELRPDSARAKKGLAQCDAVMGSLKSKESPFGRLVNSEMLKQGQDADEVSQRKLTGEERGRDRHELAQICEVLEQNGTDVERCLNERLITSLAQLARGLALSSKRERDVAVSAAMEEFIEARQQFAPRVVAMRRTMKHVRDHEGALK